MLLSLLIKIIYICKQFKPISNIKLYVIKFVNKNNIVCVSSANQFIISNYM